VIMNRATLVNPPGYSLPVIAAPCPAGIDGSCARTLVPPTAAALAHAGADVPAGLVIAAVAAIGAGLVLMVLRFRRRSAS